MMLIFTQIHKPWRFQRPSGTLTSTTTCPSNCPIQVVYFYFLIPDTLILLIQTNILCNSFTSSWLSRLFLAITSSHNYDYYCSCSLIIVMLLLISVTHIHLCNNNVCKDSLSLCCRYLKVKLPLWMYPHYLSHYIFSERLWLKTSIKQIDKRHFHKR